MRGVAPRLGQATRRTALTAQLPPRCRREVPCNAASIDASDSESEGSMRLDRARGNSHHALPGMEHWSEDEGLLPVRHPGSFPYAGAHLTHDVIMLLYPYVLSAFTHQ